MDERLEHPAPAHRLGESRTLAAPNRLSKIDFASPPILAYASAHIAWKAKAQATVNASMRYVIVHAHRFLAPAKRWSCPASAACR